MNKRKYYVKIFWEYNGRQYVNGGMCMAKNIKQARYILIKLQTQHVQDCIVGIGSSRTLPVHRGSVIELALDSLLEEPETYRR